MDNKSYQNFIVDLAGERVGSERPVNLQQKLKDYVKEANVDSPELHTYEIEIFSAICKEIDTEQDPDMAWK